MILLDKHSYYKVIDPIKGVQINHLFARAVIEQKCNGEIYVDNLNYPKTFYIKHAYGMSLLFGSSENNIFNAKLANYLLNNNSRATYEYLQVYPSLWNKKIKELLGNKIAKPGMSKSNEVITKLERVNFTFNNEKYKPTLKIKSADFVFVKTDEVLFNEIKGTVVPYLFWRNANQFIQHSIGFTLLKNDAPISTAYAAFIHNPYLEIGIETNPKYQGMGLAQWVCSALINYSLKNSFEPVWACRADNVGSCKLAQKLGFEPIKTLPYYQLPKHI